MKYWRKPLDQDRIKQQHYQVRVLKDSCKGCGFCIEFCPKRVLSESAEFNRKGYHPATADGRENECLDCGLCELICPEFAVCVVPLEESHA